MKEEQTYRSRKDNSGRSGRTGNYRRRSRSPSETDQRDYTGGVQNPCFQFFDTGQCQFGTHCRFLHDIDRTKWPGVVRGRCFRYFETGFCAFGAQCKFAHDGKTRGHDREQESIQKPKIVIHDFNSRNDRGKTSSDDNIKIKTEKDEERRRKKHSRKKKLKAKDPTEMYDDDNTTDRIYRGPTPVIKQERSSKKADSLFKKRSKHKSQKMSSAVSSNTSIVHTKTTKIITLRRSKKSVVIKKKDSDLLRDKSSRNADRCESGPSNERDELIDDDQQVSDTEDAERINDVAPISKSTRGKRKHRRVLGVGWGEPTKKVKEESDKGKGITKVRGREKERTKGKTRGRKNEYGDNQTNKKKRGRSSGSPEVRRKKRSKKVPTEREEKWERKVARKIKGKKGLRTDETQPGCTKFVVTFKGGGNSFS